MPSEQLPAQPDATERLIDEIKALRDSSEELFILLEHIWQNREDVRLQLSVVLTDNGREAIKESIGCYECDAEASGGLAQALHDGWIDLVYDSDGRAVNFVGWCPGCQQVHEAAEQQLNYQPSGSDTADTIENPIDQPQVKEENSGASNADTDTPAPPATAASVIAAEPMARSAANDSRSSPPELTADRYRKATPLITRLYLHRHMEAVVRAIGYDIVSSAEARVRLEPLVERYGQQTIEQAVEELMEPAAATAPGTVQLREDVRRMSRQILGPPRSGTVAAIAADRPPMTEAVTRDPPTTVPAKDESANSIE